MDEDESLEDRIIAKLSRRVELLDEAPQHPRADENNDHGRDEDAADNAEDDPAQRFPDAAGRIGVWAVSWCHYQFSRLLLIGCADHSRHFSCCLSRAEFLRIRSNGYAAAIRDEA